MPRKKRSQNCKPNNNNNNNHLHDENSLDSALDGDLEDCGSPSQGHQPVQRNAANARERARMRVLSRAFCRLKTTLPWVPADTKLSKLDTLRLATSYIAHLRDVLLLPAGEVPARIPQSSPPPGTSRHLTWPFTFQQPCLEPWVSRTTATSMAHSSARPVNGSLHHNPSSASSNASSCADDDVIVPEDEHHQDHEHDDDRLQRDESCLRLSGGRLLELDEHEHHHQLQYLQRYEPLLGVGYHN